MILQILYTYFLISSVVTMYMYFSKVNSNRERLDILITLFILISLTFWVNLEFGYYLFSIITCAMANFYYGRLLMVKNTGN